MSTEYPPKKVSAGSPDRPRRPTLKTIAELSGLAVPTVSRALSDSPDIGANTKVLVRRLADEIGYVPNRAGLGLRTGRTNAISLVLSARTDMMNHTAELVTSISRELHGSPFHLIVTPHIPDTHPMDPIRQVVERGSADAVIMNQIQPDDPRVRYLSERNFPFATHGRTDCGICHSYYDFDNEAFGHSAVTALAERGCRSVIGLMPPRRQSYAEHMIAAMRSRADALGVNFEVEDAADITSSLDTVRGSVTRRLRDAPSVDGYVCASTSATMAAVAGAEMSGRRVGTDIQFFAKGSTTYLKLFRPDIMVISEDLERAGIFLARAVIRSLTSPGMPPMQSLEAPTAPR